jgi:hypothetical protein
MIPRAPYLICCWCEKSKISWKSTYHKYITNTATYQSRWTFQSFSNIHLIVNRCTHWVRQWCIL